MSATPKLIAELRAAAAELVEENLRLLVFVNHARDFITGERRTLIECSTIGGDLATMDEDSREYLAELDALLALAPPAVAQASPPAVPQASSLPLSSAPNSAAVHPRGAGQP